jgi:hypothetical protein
MTSLKLVFDTDEDLKLDALKKEYGVKQTTELIRLLLTLKYKELRGSQ